MLRRNNFGKYLLPITLDLEEYKMFSVIFDMDGTLLDTQAICIPAWEYAGNLQNIPNMGECIQYVCGMNEIGWTKYLADNFKTLDIDLFKTEARKYIVQNGTVKLKKGAKELLEFLKENNIKIGVASGSSKKTVESHLKEAGVFEYFCSLTGGNEVKNGKPAPDVFLKAAESMGVDPKDCFIFEDSSNGILAGYNAGMKCIGVPDIVPFNEEIKSKMFACLNSLDEAIEIFKQCRKI